MLTVIVSFWDYTDYSIIPGYFSNYRYIFDGCFAFEGDTCLTLKTYASFILCFLTVYFNSGFYGSVFPAFHVKSTPVQIGLFLLYHTILDLTSLEWFLVHFWVAMDYLMTFNSLGSRKPAVRLVVVFALRRSGCICAPLHVVYDCAHFQFNDEDRPIFNRSSARRWS